MKRRHTEQKIICLFSAFMMIFVNVLNVYAEEETEPEIIEEAVIEKTAEEISEETVVEEVAEEQEAVVTETEEEQIEEIVEEPEQEEIVIQPEETEPENVQEVSYPAFSQSQSADGVTIMVSAEEGVFPEGAILSVGCVSAEEKQIVDEAVDNQRDEDSNVAASYTFDIKVLDQEGNEIQPADDQKVNVSFTLAEAADANLDATIYHVADSEAEVLDTDNEGNTVKAETDGFSYYTVEFTYGALQYVLPGEETVELSKVLNVLNLTGEVTNAVSSAPEFFSVEKTDGTWKTVSHKSFTSEETLAVTINDIEYIIKVTDPIETYPIWYAGEQITSENCDDVYHDGGSVKYDPSTKTLTLTDAKLTQKMPFEAKAMLVVDGITMTITGTADYHDYFITEDGINLENGANLIIKDANIIFNDPTRPICGGKDTAITVQDSYLVANGANWEGIFCGNLVVNNSTVIAKGANYGLLVFNDFILNSGYVQASATRVYYGDFIMNGGVINSPIQAYGNGDEGGYEGDIIINAGTVRAYAKDALWVYGYDYGLEADHGKIYIGSGIDSVVADGEMAFSALKQPFEIDPSLSVDPVGYTLVKGEAPWYDELTCIGEPAPSTKIATHVEIIPPGSLKVEYNANGHGKDPFTRYVKPGNTAPEPIEPSEKGYTFGGWYTEPECTNEYDFSTPVYKNTKLYAKWYADLTVKFDVQGHGSTPSSQKIPYGGTAEKPYTPYAYGYSFDGWYTEPECTTLYDFSKEVKEDITLYAKWLKDAVVTFDVQGHGTAPEAQQIKYGKTATEPEDPTEEGYVFVKWFTDSSCTTDYDFSTPVTGDITLYAKWLLKVIGMDLHADGTKLDGTYYMLNTDVLEPVFAKDTAEVEMILGHLCTDSSCSNVITAPPEKGTTYFFRVTMNDVSSFDKGIQKILFDPEIANNINATAEDAKIEFEKLQGSPSGDSVTILLKYTESEIAYTITKGADTTWTKGSSAGIDYTVKRNLSDSKTFSLFENIEVDGKIVNTTEYTAASGSLNATLKASYLEKLTVGTHYVKFNFKDGSAETKIKINPKPVKKDESGRKKAVNTGDHNGLWYSLLFVSLIHIIGVVICRIKYREG